MFLRYFYNVLIILGIHFYFVQAATAANIFDINKLLEHAEAISPEIQKAKSNNEVIKQKLITAGQIPNPEVGIGRWSGRAGSMNWEQTDITLTQPLELGGKRGSRIDVAESEIKHTSAELAASIAQVRLKTLFTLYRIRQLNEEIKLLKEARETFIHLVANFKRRPQLSPEQSTSLFIFELAEKDYQLKMDEAFNEYNLLEVEIKLLTEYSLQEVMPILPKRLKNWPRLNTQKEVNSPSLRILAAQTELSENELKLAKADVWPTVSIGPSFTSQKQFGDKANILGVVINFPIPVLNQNDGAKAVASKSIATSRKLYNLEKLVLDARRAGLEKTYLHSIKTLETQSSEDFLHKKHEAVEANFLKGLISSPLVIETHRQIFENQKLYHTRELQTLDVYYQLVLLEGRKIEGI